MKFKALESSDKASRIIISRIKKADDSVILAIPKFKLLRTNI